MNKKEFNDEMANALRKAQQPLFDRIIKLEAVVSQIVDAVPVSVLAENEKIKIRRFMQGI